ncbi:MAG: hypothetical protein R3C39_14195 [Dehalococcoidia bacterium]
MSSMKPSGTARGQLRRVVSWPPLWIIGGLWVALMFAATADLIPPSSVMARLGTRGLGALGSAMLLARLSLALPENASGSAMSWRHHWVLRQWPLIVLGLLLGLFVLGESGLVD